MPTRTSISTTSSTMGCEHRFEPGAFEQKRSRMTTDAPEPVNAERAGQTVGVALGTHNGVRFIEEQVRSILDQTRRVDEIVVSDDGSSDGTVEIIERLVEEHRGSGAPTPALVVRRNSAPLGVTENFEQAMRASSGDLIALCD